MKIAFIGTGGMTNALASKWASKHSLFFGGRSPEKAYALATQFGGQSGTQAEALAWGDVIILAVPAQGVFDAVNALGGNAAFAGKIVVDITNPISIETFLSTQPGNTSVTEALEAMLPDAHLGKAFNMAHTSVWELPDMHFDGRQYVTLFSSCDTAADTLATLIADTGSEPHRIGDNRHAYQLEAAAAIVIKLLFSGRGGNTVLNLIQPEVKAVW
jgi:8-hydroxy-5-deazaflavin:NADPH oxidoreductase